jgi:solute carrier family 25 (mitochondrial iron transporter), member 28/37
MKLVKQQGMIRLWRGASAMFVACIPSHAAYFSIYEWAKHSLGANAEGHHPVRAAAAGVIATTLHDAILTPMDVVKQRLQLGYYTGVTNCIRTIVKEEGVTAFYRSYPTTVAMNVPYAAVVVATNESMKKILNPSGNMNLPVYLLSGAVAGAAAALFTNPLDVVKTRLQTQRCRPLISSARMASSSSSNVATVLQRSPPQFLVAGISTKASAAVEYSGPLDVVRKIWASEGASGFFRGARARVMVHAPSMAISWSTYEAVKSLLTRP